MTHILAIDIGTSSLKLMRMDGEGRVLSVDRMADDSLDVHSWMQRIRENVANHGDGPAITTLSITGQMHGLLTLENGGAWGVGIPWHDQRSASMLPAIRKLIEPHIELSTGGPIAPGFQAASLAWIRKHQPERWSRILQVFLPKDALIHELTQRHVVDPSDAVGTGLFSPETGNWAWDIVGTLRIPRPWLPGIIPSGSVAGRVTHTASSNLGIPVGTPVVIAGGDAAVAAWGAGVVDEGDALVMLSSGGQVILPQRRWSPDAESRWYTWPSAKPKSARLAPYLRVGTVLNGGNALEWASTAIQNEQIPNEPTGLIALPHLLGTREDASRRGAVLGITQDTTPGQIRRATIEGVAFTLRRKLEEMIGDGPEPSHIRIGGGLAHDPALRQVFADVLGRPIAPVVRNDLSVYGAALMALGEKVPTGGPSTVQEPDPVSARTYDALYAFFRRVDDSLAPFMAALSKLELPPR